MKEGLFLCQIFFFSCYFFFLFPWCERSNWWWRNDDGDGFFQCLKGGGKLSCSLAICFHKDHVCWVFRCRKHLASLKAVQIGVFGDVVPSSNLGVDGEGGLQGEMLPDALEFQGRLCVVFLTCRMLTFSMVITEKRPSSMTASGATFMPPPKNLPFPTQKRYRLRLCVGPSSSENCTRLWVYSNTV